MSSFSTTKVRDLPPSNLFELRFDLFSQFAIVLEGDQDYSTAHNIMHELPSTGTVCVVNSLLFFLIF